MASKGEADNVQEQSSPVEGVAVTEAGAQSTTVDDPELDAILDSALADFEKPKENLAKKAATVKAEADSSTDTGEAPKQSGKASSQDGAALNPEDGLPEDLNYDFMADAMNKQFEDTFAALMNDPNLKKQFEDLAGSAEQAASDNNPTAFADTVERALNSLNLNAENIQGDPNQQELWEQLSETLGAEAGGAGLGGAGAGLDAMGGMFQNMVKQLLSKELLYDPLKEVAEKYKEYLEKESHKLPGEDLERYRKQLEIVETVVQHLDGDSDSHSLEEKNARFEILLDLLQRMHELGQPPQEVVGEGNVMMPDFANLAGQIPGMGDLGSGQDPSQCSLM
ncbi:peroxisomal biogenesis factor 19 [Aplysia californica]|uniref:Peroxin-19 n=1 Tax=Aplysia californica TaxID=6500 RepID=A0ABM0JBL8_APLCA|nr:peroxisomal biogenesis factor 19 [Aplysia californica]